MSCLSVGSRAPELLRLKEGHKLLDPSVQSAVFTLQRADVYSFAIVLYEIHFLGPGLLERAGPNGLVGFNTGKGLKLTNKVNKHTSIALHRDNLTLSGGCKTFGEPNMTPREILERVFVGPSDYDVSQGFRPQTATLGNCLQFVKNCLSDCWCETASERTDFKACPTHSGSLRAPKELI